MRKTPMSRWVRTEDLSLMGGGPNWTIPLALSPITAPLARHWHVQVVASMSDDIKDEELVDYLIVSFLQVGREVSYLCCLLL